MNGLLDVVSGILLVGGALFFTAGTIGLVRFPDLRSRLHALTKADNLGLGLMFAGTAIQLGSWRHAGVLLVTWLLAVGAASVSAHTLAGIEASRADLDGRSGAPDRGDGGP